MVCCTTITMESILLLFLVVGSSYSQLECQGSQGMPVCNGNPPGAWRSDFRVSKRTREGRIEYEASWSPDPSPPPSGVAYRVVVREQDNPQETPTLLPATNSLEMTIPNSMLRAGVAYEAMVCLDGVSVMDLPPPDEFQPECGFCRTCFRADSQPTNNVRPIINNLESTVMMFPPGSRIAYVYECEAFGVPLPTVTWIAIDRRNQDERPISNRTEQISIASKTEVFEITSTLTIFEGSNFFMPTCIAENSEGPVEFSEFVEVPPGTTGFDLDLQTEVSLPIYAIVIIVVALFLVIVGLLILVAVILCVRRKRSRKRRRLIELPTNTEKNVPLSSTTESSFLSKQSTRKASLLKKLPDKLILSPDALQVSAIIGQGEFGVVYKGYLKSDMMDTVAVKTLKGIFATARDIENVSAEIMKMHRFQHPNVMALIGVCMGPSKEDSSAGPCIVMPFMAKGSLLDYLRKEADNLFAESEEANNLSDVRNSLVQMCLQISQGMEYLAKLRFIHRDLAARNCLMDTNGVIKVSDFGLAEDIYSQNYFRQVEGGVKLPLKWMALESIKMAVFTEKTDVWSYGVTCWEIFTGGSIPYPGVHPQAVLDFIEEGGRLARPKNAACCDNMYKLLLSCWERKNEARPKFSTIVNTLSNFLLVSSNYLDLSQIDKKDGEKPTQIEDNEHHDMKHVPANPNDYYMAGGV